MIPGSANYERGDLLECPADPNFQRLVRSPLSFSVTVMAISMFCLAIEPAVTAFLNQFSDQESNDCENCEQCNYPIGHKTLLALNLETDLDTLSHHESGDLLD